MYKDYCKHKYNTKSTEVALVFSEDAHYIMFQASILLDFTTCGIDLDYESRALKKGDMVARVSELKDKEHQFFIIISK